MRRTRGTQLRRRSLTSWLLVVVIVAELSTIALQEAGDQCHYNGVAIPCNVRTR